MVRNRMLAAVIATGMCVASVLAQDGVLPAAGAGEARMEESAENTGMDKRLPGVDFQGTSLEDAIEFLQKASPGFRASISRAAGVPDDYPRITLKMKDVTVAQVLELMVAAYPDHLQVNDIGDDSGIRVVRVTADPNMNDLVGKDQITVQVYNLDTVIAKLSDRVPNAAGAEKAVPSDHVLSLVAATLEQVPSKTPPVLRLHSETQTLIFRGDGRQRAALETVLDALRPTESNESKALLQMKADVAGYQFRLERMVKDFEVSTSRAELEQKVLKEAHAVEQQALKDALAVERERSRALELEIEKLRLRLTTLQAQPNEKAEPAGPAKQ